VKVEGFLAQGINFALMVGLSQPPSQGHYPDEYFSMKHHYLFFLLTCSFGLALPSAQAQSAATSSNAPIFIDAGSNSPLAAAAISGGRSVLQSSVAGSSPALAMVASSIDKRMSADFEASGRAAESCFKRALGLGTMPDVALVCAQVWASNAMLRGDLLRWADITQSTWDQVRPQLVKLTGRENLTVKTLATAQAVHALPGTSAMSVAVDAKKRSFPLAWEGKSEGPMSPRAYIDAVVDGKKVRMLVDTGSEVSVLSSHDAAMVGIPTRKGGIPVRGMKDVTTATNGLGFVKNLHVANLEVRNARMLVVDTGDSILGMDLLWRVGDAMRMSRHELRVLPGTAPEATGCQGDIRILVDFSGFMEWALTLPVQIDGKSEFAIMDSGENGYVSLYADNSPLQTSSTRVPFVRRTINANKETAYTPGKVGIESGARKVRADLMIFPKDGGRTPWSLGSGVLNDFDIVMDFRRHHACLVPGGAH
jgi:hypothetical protein